jgi:hypothetical protein
MKDDAYVYIGNRYRQGHEEAFGLSPATRGQHVYIIGQTGTGKSTLLRNLIIQDIFHGHGVGLIDPHGDLAADVLDHIPRQRTREVMYFDPSDRDYPVGINLVGNVPEERRPLVASGVVRAFKAIWGDFWGPRLEYILHAAVSALLDCENASILGVPRMLVDERYRHWVVKQVKDPAIRFFWANEFARYDKRFLLDVISPIQNKVGQLVHAPVIRNIFGQVRSRFDPRFLMDNSRIFVASLSKGRLGDDKANLIGAMLTTQFELAAMSRADVPEAQRRDFCLYVDEFHNFATDSFAAILSEARKYRLGLTLSHQYTAQLSPTVRDAIFGNVGTLISFRVGEIDASVLARAFGGQPPYGQSHFSSLPNYHAAIRMLEGGEPTDPFTGQTLPPIEAEHQRRSQIIRRSRQRYGAPRSVVEDRIQRWMER